MLEVEQILSQADFLQQDRAFLQHLGNLISVTEVECLLHPLAQFSALLKKVQDKPIPLAFDEVIFLDQYFKDLEVQATLSKDEWLPLQ